MFTNASKQVFF